MWNRRFRNASTVRSGIAVVLADERVRDAGPEDELAHLVRPDQLVVLVDDAVVHPRDRHPEGVHRERPVLQLGVDHRQGIDLGHPVAPPDQLHRRETALPVLVLGRRRRAEAPRDRVPGDGVGRHLRDHRRHRAEEDRPRRAVLRALLPVARGGEPGLQVARAAGVERRVGDDVERGDVEERERGGEHVVLGALLAVRAHRRVEVEEVVRVDGALRARGRAGRVLDQAPPVVRRERPRVRRRPRPPSQASQATVSIPGRVGSGPSPTTTTRRTRPSEASASRRSARSARTTITSTSLCSITCWSRGPRESALSGTVRPPRTCGAVEGGHELGLVPQEEPHVRARVEAGRGRARGRRGRRRATRRRTSGPRSSRRRATACPAGRPPGRRGRGASSARAAGSGSRRGRGRSPGRGGALPRGSGGVVGDAHAGSPA